MSFGKHYNAQDGKKRWVNDVQTTHRGMLKHTHLKTNWKIYIFPLSVLHTHRGYMMRVPLKQSVNQSHTNSQGFVVAIRDGGRCSVTVDTADSH